MNNTNTNINFEFMFAGQLGKVENEVVTWNNKRFLVRDAQKATRYCLEMERLKALNIPDTVRFYHNPNYIDCWKIVFLDRPVGTEGCFTLSYDDADYICDELACTPGYHLGKRVWISDLPSEIRGEVMAEIRRHYE